jgi:hypothetical protein
MLLVYKQAQELSKCFSCPARYGTGRAAPRKVSGISAVERETEKKHPPSRILIGRTGEALEGKPTARCVPHGVIGRMAINRCRAATEVRRKKRVTGQLVTRIMA